MLSVADKDSFVPLSIKVVSSAYWLILTSDFFIVRPLISLLDLIALARISADRIKRYGERGQPCLTPRCSSKKLLAHPLFRIQLSIFFVKCLNPFSQRGAKVLERTLDKGPLERVKGFFKIDKK